MAFKVTVTGLDDISKQTLVTEVLIERRIYTHSEAKITFRWDEHTPYGDRQTANMAAKALNCNVEVVWKDDDLKESVTCFTGYVEQARGQRTAGRSYLTLHCVAASKRTDQVPRYRAFQATTMQAICQQIAKTEPLIKIKEAGDLDFDIPLSVQFNETDFDYLRRMLQSWGIPMACVEKTGEVQLGARGEDSDGKFPDITYGWTEVEFQGAVHNLPKRVGGGSGPTSSARGQVDQFNGQLKPKASDYYPVEDYKYLTDRVSSVRSQVDTANYRLLLENAVLPYNPGQVVKFENQDEIIREVRIVARPLEGVVTQEFFLQSFTLPYFPDLTVPQWKSRLVWAHVVDNQKDPMQAGRLQVKFLWETLDPQSSSEKVWLPMLTPYGGGKSPNDGKAGEYSGFYSVPEIGERVVVEFLGDWDSEAVIMGVAREKSVNPMNDAQETKRWRTPSGNEITMTTSGSDEVVRIKVKDKVFLESKMSGSNAEVLLTPGESAGDYIHLKKGAGPSTLYIMSDGNISIKAGMKLHLEGQQVQVKAGGGPVNIDGGPLVNINCVPLPFTPNQLQQFKEKTQSTSQKDRKLPQPPAGTAATSASASDSSSNQQDDNKKDDKKKTWIEIVLKDEATGDPIPNEKYKIKLPDGTIKEGTLDGDGRARVDGIEEGQAEVSFPDMGIDWKKA